MGSCNLTSAKMFLLLSCLAVTSLASPLQFERVPILDNSLPLLVQDRVPNPCLTKANDTCIFPFTYNGVEYYRCTYAGQDLHLVHQGGRRPGQALVLHHGRPGWQPCGWPGTIWILLSRMQLGDM